MPKGTRGGRGGNSGVSAWQGLQSPPPTQQNTQSQKINAQQNSPDPINQQNQQNQQQNNNSQQLNNLISAMQQANKSAQKTSNSYNNFHIGEGSSTPDFTNNGDPNLVKWQNTTDEAKMASYLAKLGKAQTPYADAEGYTYHQSAFQNMVIDQNLNSPVYATLNTSDFNKYCKQTGLQPFYRGWSGTQSMNVFANGQSYHSGTGMYGEGTYCGDLSTANSYAGSRNAISKMALSPNARVVDLADVQAALGNIKSSRTASAFRHSGSTGGSYSNNSGESQMALKMGYNVIRTSWSYVVLDRSAVVLCK